MPQLLELYVDETKTEAYEDSRMLKLHALAAQGDAKGIKKQIQALDGYANS